MCTKCQKNDYFGEIKNVQNVRNMYVYHVYADMEKRDIALIVVQTFNLVLNKLRKYRSSLF